MARIVQVADVDQGLKDLIEIFKADGVKEDSRNGPVLRLDGPTIIEYTDPEKRVVLSALRDANPYFHFMESLWMMAGMNDLRPLLKYNPGMANYSDDGKTLRGTAYGHRWRRTFFEVTSNEFSRPVDQLEEAVLELRNRSSRRVVISMWDPREISRNVLRVSKDVPCNLQILLSVQAGTDNVLDVTVTNRSNDLIYGCLGSNVFHFSFLHEIMAQSCKMEIGKYYQFSNNLHIYTENEVAKRCLEGIADEHNPSRSYQLLSDGCELSVFTPLAQISSVVYQNPGWEETRLGTAVKPLIDSYDLFKKTAAIAKLNVLSESELATVRIRNLTAAVEMADKIPNQVLRQACTLWMNRRLQKALENAKTI